MEEYRYALWLVLAWIPFIYILVRYKKQVKPFWRAILVSTGLIFPVGVAWDYFAMYKGVWFFLPPFSTPIILGHFPLEEFLLILSIPMWSGILFAYFSHILKDH